MNDKSALTALIGYLAAWEDREGSMAAMMPHEYEPFMEGLKTLCVRYTPRTARHELSALAQPDAQAQQQAELLRRAIVWLEVARDQGIEARYENGQPTPNSKHIGKWLDAAWRALAVPAAHPAAHQESAVQSQYQQGDVRGQPAPEDNRLQRLDAGRDRRDERSESARRADGRTDGAASGEPGTGSALGEPRRDGPANGPDVAGALHRQADNLLNESGSVTRVADPEQPSAALADELALIRSVRTWIENFKVPQNVAQAGWQVIQGGHVLEQLAELERLASLRSVEPSRTVPEEWTKQEVEAILKLRDELIGGNHYENVAEAYHQLYMLASFRAANPYNVWAELEAAAPRPCA